MNSEPSKRTKQNIDRQEIAKFEAVAAHWWDPEGEFKPLHRINPLRLHYIMQRADGVFSKKVLDIGCGGGILAESIANEGGQVTGLDMGRELLKVARLHALESGVSVTYVQETVETHAQANIQQYDVVSCMEVLEHVPDPASVVYACSRLVKPGGHVFFSTINRNAKSWLLAVIGAEYILKIIPKGTHDHQKFIRPSELISWVDGTPLHEKHMIGLHYNPFNEHFKLSHNVSLNYIVHLQNAV
ncbi:Ubiquinone biosynthesis O-methyltransferase [Serratia symbiotica]|nr:Ubiquinone biosynthesis O-methyltransferase [Serratia symbiotica]